MEFLTVKETAQLLRVSPITVRRYIASGQLAAERVGRGIRVRRKAIEEFVTPVEPKESLGKPFTFDDPLWNIVRLGRSEGPNNVASNKHQHVANSLLSEFRDPEDDIKLDGLSVKLSTPGDPPRSAFGEGEADDLEADEELPTFREQLGNFIGIGHSGGPGDVSANKHEHLAQATVASWSDDSRAETDRKKPRTILEGLEVSAGIGRSGERTDIANYKDEYLADAFDPKE